MTWTDKSAEMRTYLEARSRRGGAGFRRTVHNPRSGLYVLWVENRSRFRVRDFQRVPKTEILPLACSVKAGRFERGFFERRDLDDTQLHVRGDAPQQHHHWRRGRSNHWMVFREVFRGIYGTDQGVANEQRLVGLVRTWLATNGLLIQPGDRQSIIEQNNADHANEPIGPIDFPGGEWMHVRAFGDVDFRTLMAHVVSSGVQ